MKTFPNKQVFLMSDCHNWIKRNMDEIKYLKRGKNAYSDTHYERSALSVKKKKNYLNRCIKNHLEQKYFFRVQNVLLMNGVLDYMMMK